jgi:hypothetical protein
VKGGQAAWDLLPMDAPFDLVRTPESEKAYERVDKKMLDFNKDAERNQKEAFEKAKREAGQADKDNKTRGRTKVVDPFAECRKWMNR